MTFIAGSNLSPARRAIGIFLGLSLLIPQALHAQPNPDMIESEKEFLSKPDWERWSESDQLAFPQAPRKADLVALDSDLTDGRYEYFIDRASVSMGNDQVLRYTVVLQSSGGGRNVLYEGIRCATSEFKTYAYATHSGEFRPLTSASWRKLSTTAPYDYRRLLAERYVCDRDGWPLDEKQVQKRIAQNDPGRNRQRPRPAGN